MFVCVRGYGNRAVLENGSCYSVVGGGGQA